MGSNCFSQKNKEYGEPKLDMKAQLFQTDFFVGCKIFYHFLHKLPKNKILLILALLKIWFTTLKFTL